MRIQRKLLTGKQKEKICDKYGGSEFCDGCPLRVLIRGEIRCPATIKLLEKEIKIYWDAEVEIDL